MNKFFIFAALCVASVSCVNLQNLCSSDTFKYNGVLVNAFHVIRQNMTFEPLGHYLINGTIKCDHFEFANKTKFWEALKIKHNYNTKFAKFYSTNLQVGTVEQIQTQRLELESLLLSLRSMIEEEMDVKCLRLFQDAAYSGFQVFTTLLGFLSYNKLPTQDEADYKPSTLEAVDILEGIMKKLKAVGGGQTFALASDAALDVYFDRSLVLPKEFKLLTDDLHMEKIMVIYDLYMPFNNKAPPNGPCVGVDKLPLFYWEKGNAY